MNNKTGKVFRWRQFIALVLILLTNKYLECSPAKHRSKINRKREQIRVSQEYRDVSKLPRKHQVNFNAPQLSKKDKTYLSKLEDALQNKEGTLLYTNSWAVQMNQAEVAQADRIAEKHGFENVGQVSFSGIFVYSIRSCEFNNKKTKTRATKRSW